MFLPRWWSTAGKSLVVAGFALTLMALLQSLELLFLFNFDETQVSLDVDGALVDAPSKAGPRKDLNHTYTPLRPSIPSRAFPTWEGEMGSHTPLPCIINSNETQQFGLGVQNREAGTGLLFVKIEKAGSSTLAGVVGRTSEIIYRNQKQNKTLVNETGHIVAPKRNGAEACKCRGMTHLWSFKSPEKLFNNEDDRSKRFLWSIVRRPADRLISQYFHFEVTRANASTADADIIKYLQMPQYQNRQTQYLYPHPNQIHRVNRYSSEKRLRTWRSLLQKILLNYNFIGTLERLDESLVLLQLIMGLNASDVIPLTAKSSTREHELDMNGLGKCNTYVKSFVSPAVQQFLDSQDEFRRFHEADFMLYEAVDNSMNATIDSIGRERFERALQEFRRVKEYATENKCTYVNPCVREGVMRPWWEVRKMCYLGDAGCGHKCLDDLFEED
jgi:hypothetical protein